MEWHVSDLFLKGNVSELENWCDSDFSSDCNAFSSEFRFCSMDFSFMVNHSLCELIISWKISEASSRFEGTSEL